MKIPFADGNSVPKLAYRLKFACLLVAAAAAAGCGKGSDSKKPATQVAARVNGDEITVHQVNEILARQRVAPEKADAAKRQILERLIDQYLARQQAVEKKLDRTPRVVQTIEAARTEILARSFVEQIAAAQAKPTAEEVKKYYDEHPELFAKRRIFSLEEMVVTHKGGPIAGLKERAAKAKNMAELANWLKTQNAEVAAQRGVRAAEQIPLTWLADLQTMKDGETRVFEAGERLNVIRVVASRSVPVDEATATPAIQQFLFNQRLTDAIGKEVLNMRGKSNIEYMGEFVAKSPEAKPKPAPQPFQPPSEPSDSNNQGFEKGLRGLMR